MGIKKMPELKIGDLIASTPIIQGGMSVGISLSGLASAVANEGGIGVIGAAAIGMLEPDFANNFREANLRALRREIRKAKEKTKGIIGVNIMVALSDYEDLLRVSIEEAADVLFLGAGLPLKNPKVLFKDMFDKIKTKVVPIVSSAKAANLILRYWAKNYNELPDAIVVEGPKAGGHLGFKEEQINDPQYSLDNILTKVIEVVKKFEQKFHKNIPVIAAGGIYTGKDIKKYIDMGAQGVQMATRFVATNECDADEEFKRSYIKAKKEDIVIIKSPVGLPGRAINNRFLEEVKDGIRKPFKCFWKCLKTCDYRKSPYCIVNALTNAKRGNLRLGFGFAGANVYRVDKIVSVKALMEELRKEYLEQ